MIADTSFLIDVMAKELSAVKKAGELEKQGFPIFVGSPSVFELFVGVILSKKVEDERSKIISIVGSLPQLPLGFSSASTGGSIYGKKMAGSRIDPEDAMLAGIAKVHGETIITRNVKHFSGLEGITVEGY